MKVSGEAVSDDIPLAWDVVGVEGRFVVEEEAGEVASYFVVFGVADRIECGVM